MALDTTNSQQPIITSSPRIITVYDADTGCPNTSRANPLLTTTVTVTRPSYFWVMANMRRNASGRTDAYIYFQGPAGSNYAGGLNTPRLNWTANQQPVTVAFDAGFYGNTAGTYTINLTAASPTVWGCGRQWGKMFIMVCEV